MTTPKIMDLEMRIGSVVEWVYDDRRWHTKGVVERIDNRAYYAVIFVRWISMPDVARPVYIYSPHEKVSTFLRVCAF